MSWRVESNSTTHLTNNNHHQHDDQSSSIAVRALQDALQARQVQIDALQQTIEALREQKSNAKEVYMLKQSMEALASANQRQAEAGREAHRSEVRMLKATIEDLQTKQKREVEHQRRVDALKDEEIASLRRQLQQHGGGAAGSHQAAMMPSSSVATTSQGGVRPQQQKRQQEEAYHHAQEQQQQRSGGGGGRRAGVTTTNSNSNSGFLLQPPPGAAEGRGDGESQHTHTSAKNNGPPQEEREPPPSQHMDPQSAIPGGRKPLRRTCNIRDNTTRPLPFVFKYNPRLAVTKLPPNTPHQPPEVVHPGDNSWRTCVFGPSFTDSKSDATFRVNRMYPVARIFFGVVPASGVERLLRDNMFVGTVGLGSRNDYARCNGQDVKPQVRSPAAGGVVAPQPQSQPAHHGYPQFNKTDAIVTVSVDFDAQEVTFVVDGDVEGASVFSYHSSSTSGGGGLQPEATYPAVSIQAGSVVTMLDG